MSVREVSERNKSKSPVKREEPDVRRRSRSLGQSFGLFFEGQCPFHTGRNREHFRDASQLFSHADVFNGGEHRFARRDNEESVPDIEFLDIVTGVKNDGCRARGTGPAFAFPQDEASQAMTLGLRIDRHETNLGFRGGVEMQATDGESARIGADDHEMLAVRFTVIFLGTARLIPRGAQNTPPQIEIIFPFRRSSRRAGRFGDVFNHPCDYSYGGTDREANL